VILLVYHRVIVKAVGVMNLVGIMEVVVMTTKKCVPTKDLDMKVHVLLPIVIANLLMEIVIVMTHVHTLVIAVMISMMYWKHCYF